MALDEVKALCFEIFGTVVDWRGSIAREADAVAARHGLELDGNQFALDWRALYQPAMSKVRDGNIDFVKLDILHRMNLEALLEHHPKSGHSNLVAIQDPTWPLPRGFSVPQN